MPIEHVAILSAWVLLAGFWLGKWATNNKWVERGAEGYPRVECRGKLYWVNRDDKPCFRCGAPFDSSGEVQCES